MSEEALAPAVDRGAAAGVAAAAATLEEPAPDPGPTVLRDCADAEAYVASVCFKHGPPRLVGVELEWLLHHPAAPRAPVDVGVLRAALGPHAPTSLDPASPALPLPGGSTVTVEPGGQVELASPPLPGVTCLVDTTTADADVLHRLLAAHGLAPLPRAADPVRPPVRLLDLPRYRAMECVFDRHGMLGRSAMCSTAAVQVCLDAGVADQVASRWAAVHALGPVLLGAFANSPVLHGKRTGWKSSRWMTWQRADPVRTAAPARAATEGPDPAAAWAHRVVHSPVLCVRGGRQWAVPEQLTFADWIRGGLTTPPTIDDLRYHVSTLFPPVRPHGHLEVRYVDMQPGRGWALPTAALVALLSDPGITDMARAACEPAAQHWLRAARVGLDDPVLTAAATAVFELARDRLPELGAPAWLVDDLDAMTERQVRRGLCPADRPDDLEEPG